jgi:hypothetical protein
MSYVIACWKNGIPHGITVGKDEFNLVNVSRLFNHPHRSGMQRFLTWIKENDESLKCEDFSIQDYGRFRK